MVWAGGTVNANLGLGTVNQTSGTTALNGTVDALAVNVNGGTLALGASDRLDNGATVTVGAGGHAGHGRLQRQHRGPDPERRDGERDGQADGDDLWPGLAAR